MKVDFASFAFDGVVEMVSGRRENSPSTNPGIVADAARRCNHARPVTRTLRDSSMIGPCTAIYLSLLILTACGGSDKRHDQKSLAIDTSLDADRESAAFEDFLAVARSEFADVQIALSKAQRPCPDRMTCLEPTPDVVQLDPGGGIQERVALGSLESIDALADEGGWMGVLPGDVLASVRDSRDGKLYGAPFFVERTNTLFYNKRVLSQSGLAPPRHVPDLLAVAEALARNGTTALALPVSNIESLLFDGLLLAEANPQVYLDYLTERATGDDPSMQRALSDLVKLIEYTGDNSGRADWTAAVSTVCQGNAAMVFLPYFAKAEFERDGCGPDMIGYTPLEPPDTPSFLFATLSFGLVKGTPNREAALAFLGMMESKEGQDALSSLKGAIPTRLDTDVRRFDAMSQQTITDFLFNGEMRLPAFFVLASYQYQTTIAAALRQFADPSASSYKSVPTMLTVLMENYQFLKP